MEDGQKYGTQFGGNTPQKQDWIKWGGIAAAVVAVLGIAAWFLFKGKGGDDDLDRAEIAAVRQAMQAEMARPDFATRYLTDEPRHKLILKNLSEYYQGRRYRPIWLSDDGVTADADTALAVLRRSYGDGLEPGNYMADTMRVWRDSLQGRGILKASPARLAEFELALSGNLLQYAAHMATGRINPGRLDTMWKFEPRPIALDSFLNRAHKGTLIEEMANLQPRTPEYTRLKQALGRYRNINGSGGWPVIPAGGLDSGAQGPQILALKRRLAMDNYMDSNSTAGKSPVFDMETAQAVRTFQGSIGHATTGKIDKKTLEMLNHPASWWVRHMELNLERMRWMGTPPEGTYILVNVPDYSLKVLRDGKEEMSMCVVVGDEYHSTPVFSGKIKDIIFNPDWIIPRSIAAKEVLPILQRNKRFLTRDSIDVYESWEEGAKLADTSKIDWMAYSEENFPFKLVQKPGKRNPLGRIKFIFPNERSVYLHDTPFREGFKKRMRDMSHGCIRVEHPDKLASLLLEDEPEGGRKYMDDIFLTNIPTEVDLEKPVPVQIAYLTTWADENGRVQYREDLYGHDADHIKAIYEKEKNLMVSTGDVRNTVTGRRAALPSAKTRGKP